MHGFILMDRSHAHRGFQNCQCQIWSTIVEYVQSAYITNVLFGFNQFTQNLCA